MDVMLPLLGLVVFGFALGWLAKTFWSQEEE